MLFASALLLAACDSVLDVDPTASINAEEALNTPRKIEVAVQGSYSILQANDYYGGDGVNIIPDLYADDLDFTGTFTNLYSIDIGAIASDNTSLPTIWSNLYDGINRANVILAAIPEVENLSASVAAQATGEQLFLRALHYYNLVTLFGGVPLVLEPTRTLEDITYPERSSADAIWAQVEADLRRVIDEELLTGLSDLGPGRATEAAAKALLARVHLYQGEYTQAGVLANDVITNYGYGLVGEYRTLFENKNSEESIFEVQFNRNDANSLAFFFLPSSNPERPAEQGGRRQFAPSVDLYEAYEEGDTRRDRVVGIYSDPFDGPSLYGRKYFRISSQDDNFIVLRLAEMYLIRAETRARAGDVLGALADLNAVRERADVGVLVGVGGDALLEAILEERRREFALENQRFFDLRRFGLIDEDFLFPIPQREIDVNPGLEQNPDY